MVLISNVSDETSFHETVLNKEEHHFPFSIAQSSASKRPYLLGRLSHSNFLNTILIVMCFRFEW